MNIVLATGIYPPDIGGPATYVSRLSEVLRQKGETVTVITYQPQRGEVSEQDGVIRVKRGGGSFMRWFRYAKVLRMHAANADIVYAFSSVSVGVPLWMSHVRHPRRVLRLGGDFLWERYTDKGGTLSLRDWYAKPAWRRNILNGLLRKFDHIVFSTRFQEELCERTYRNLPFHNVIENALQGGNPSEHQVHDPLRLLYFGRFVSFKNLGTLLVALAELPEITLTLVGEGPLQGRLQTLALKLGVESRVHFRPTEKGEGKVKIFAEHDLLVLPSLTEISPNAALEARAAGLPVLLTEETGLERALADGMMLRRLRSAHDIMQALRDAHEQYAIVAGRAAQELKGRSWEQVADEHLTLFRALL